MKGEKDLEILVVEDNQIIATEVARILKKGEYRSSSVLKGKESIDYLNRNKNKSMIVVSDMDMPERGFYFAPSQFEAVFVSTVHGEKEIDATVDAFKEVIKGF